MAPVLGLLEAREKKIREEVARLKAAPDAAERQLERPADARMTAAEVLAEPGDEAAVVLPVTVAGRSCRAAPKGSRWTYSPPGISSSRRCLAACRPSAGYE
ncbi:hypothetical protein [Streptomyces sp. NPDC102360]|uniref:hypothetical protein n=1 Tax=Streptomyces sp. NPDC102360 TaxID=3366160 RepID=UPI0037FB0027